MRKIILNLIFATVCATTALPYASAQSLYERFDKACENTDSLDYDEMEYCINEMRRLNDVSSERFIDEFNYYVFKSYYNSGIIMSTELPDEEGIKVQYEMTQDGEIEGYMYYIEKYDNTYADSAIMAIKEGIRLHPENLYMRFGHIHFLSLLKRWEDYTVAIENTLDYSKKIKNNWYYPGIDAPMDTVLIYSILEYESRLLDACELTPETMEEDAELTAMMRRIAQKMLGLYPDNGVQYNIMAVSYNAMDNYSQALPWLLKAEKQSPKDMIVLFNIVNTYNYLYDDKNVKKYLKKIKKYGDDELKEKAQKWIDEMKYVPNAERHYNYD